MAEKEYIEKNHLMKTLINSTAYYNATVFYVIKREPTADVQEVRHGKWIKSKHIKFGNEFKCLFCDYSYFTDDMEYNFCPHCGAKMDKE